MNTFLHSALGIQVLSLWDRNFSKPAGLEKFLSSWFGEVSVPIGIKPGCQELSGEMCS